MKHQNSICFCCKIESKHSRLVAVTNIENVILCNTCNVNLIHLKELELNNEVTLKVIGKRGDFDIITAVIIEKELTNDEFWSNRKRVDELNQMSGFPSFNGIQSNY